MDIKSFILANKEVIEKLAIKKDEEKVIKKMMTGIMKTAGITFIKN